MVHPFVHIEEEKSFDKIYFFIVNYARSCTIIEMGGSAVNRNGGSNTW